MDCLQLLNRPRYSSFSLSHLQVDCGSAGSSLANGTADVMAFVLPYDPLDFQAPVLRNGVSILIGITREHEFLGPLARPENRGFWRPSRRTSKRRVRARIHHLVLREVREHWSS